MLARIVVFGMLISLCLAFNMRVKGPYHGIASQPAKMAFIDIPDISQAFNVASELNKCCGLVY